MTEEKKLTTLMPARMKLAEYERQDWVVNAEEGTKISDILEPNYWAHVAAKFKPYDAIEVRAEDGSWIANFIVLGCDRNWAKVHLLSEHMLSTADVSLTQATKHLVKWRGPEHKWSVIRLSDSQVLKTSFTSKDDACRWVIEHEKVTG